MVCDLHHLWNERLQFGSSSGFFYQGQNKGDLSLSTHVISTLFQEVVPLTVDGSPPYGPPILGYYHWLILMPRVNGDESDTI